MTSLEEAYGVSPGRMLHYEDEQRISRGKVTRKQIEYELWYNDLWYIARIFGVFACIFPPSTGEWENKNFIQKIFTNREVKEWNAA